MYSILIRSLFVRSFYILLFVLVLSGCSSGSGRTTNNNISQGLSSIQVLAPERVPNNSTNKLKAIGLYLTGESKDITDQVVWSSGDENKARIEKSGVMSMNSVGKVIMYATLGSVTGSAEIDITSGDLSSLSMQPLPGKNSYAPQGSNSYYFLVTGHYQDGTSFNLTSAVVWSSSDTNIVKINQDNGYMELLRPGSAEITARFNGVEVSRKFVVTDAVLEKLSISSSNGLELPVGTNTNLIINAEYSSGTILNKTNEVQLTSSNQNVASISGNQVIAKADGSATITASLGEITSSITINVVAFKLDSIEISLANPSYRGDVYKGQSLGIIAKAKYVNMDQLIDITNQVNWYTSDSKVGFVDNANLVGNDSGTVNIWATYGDKASSKLTFNVSDATLKEIQISAQVPNSVVGLRNPLTAIATYSDGSTRTMDNQELNWRCKSGESCDVSTTGVIYPASSGVLNITATPKYGTEIFSNTITSIVNPREINLYFVNKNNDLIEIVGPSREFSNSDINTTTALVAKVNYLKLGEVSTLFVQCSTEGVCFNVESDSGMPRKIIARYGTRLRVTSEFINVDPDSGGTPFFYPVDRYLNKFGKYENMFMLAGPQSPTYNKVTTVTVEDINTGVFTTKTLVYKCTGTTCV